MALIVVHEFGHFIAAKWMGMRVDEFGIGFPPRAVRFAKKGETEYTLNWLPLGGFVKIYGEDPASPRDERHAGRAFYEKNRAAQALVLVAGVAMNLLFAYVLITGALLAGTPRALSADEVSMARDTELAVARVLPEFPMVNGTVSGDQLIHRGRINIGIAVDLNPGLIVPVVREAEDLTLVGIAKRINDLAGRARDRKLKPDEIQGATFSITNPGVLGTYVGMPIIPEGTAAILGTGSIEKRPVVVEADGVDSIAIRLRSMFSLGYDHRIVDGADAARFLAAFALHGFVRDVVATVKYLSALHLGETEMPGTRGGEAVKMSKRAGTVVSLREVVEEVGRDATRFMFLTRRSDAQLDFDLVGVDPDGQQVDLRYSANYMFQDIGARVTVVHTMRRRGRTGAPGPRGRAFPSWRRSTEAPAGGRWWRTGTRGRSR